MSVQVSIELEFLRFYQDHVTPLLMKMLLDEGWTTHEDIEEESINIVLTWQNTNIGGTFTFKSNEQLSIDLNINRKIISNSNNFEITDFNWYLTRILPIFHENNIEVFSFSCKESFNKE